MTMNNIKFVNSGRNFYDSDQNNKLDLNEDMAEKVISSKSKSKSNQKDSSENKNPSILQSKSISKSSTNNSSSFRGMAGKKRLFNKV